ncbi:MAG: 23S rRNA (uracil(1939)-C(5))-methyltransferase RlmD [Acetatifactor sp.]|nr:23S rRNA (uracil(1939)-C(5))-methyltransferase RlmD [Acetatifactor sp.]
MFEKNEIVEVTITDCSTEGEGIGKKDGFALFVKDAVIGDRVKVKVLKAKKTYAYARLEEIIEPSPYRVEPKCPYHRQCGGCQIQALSYEKQLEFKQQKITNNLIRIGGFSQEFVDSITEPIVGMEEPYHYRNKAQYPIGTDKNGKPIAGFYAGRTHSIIANTDCALGARENKIILETILNHMEKNGIPAYDEEAGTGLIRHVLIRTAFTGGQIMVCLVINKKNTKGEIIKNQNALIESLIKIQGMHSISVSINTEKTNVIMGKQIINLWGEERIEDTIHVRDMKKEGYPFTGEELTFSISPLSFYQVNPKQTEKLYSLALEYAGLTGKESVWDLYCGIGTISLFMAGKAGKVYGVEIVPQAIEDARKNAERNSIKNAEFFVGKAEEVLPGFYEKNSGDEMLHPDVIVVDPPRKGCDEACLTTMLKMEPKRIVYVSCDSATLARDLKILCEGGYELKRVRGVDQFGHSVHVETVVLLSHE